MITIEHAAHHANRIGGAIVAHERHIEALKEMADKIGNPHLTLAVASAVRSAGIIHAQASIAVIAAETLLGAKTGTIYPLGGGDKPPASS